MRYIIAIEPGNETRAFGVIIPDLPGCFSAGDTMAAALTNARDSAIAWIEATLDAGDRIPPPSPFAALRGRADFAGWTFSAIEVPPDHRPGGAKN